jgi:hypothetical protein
MKNRKGIFEFPGHRAEIGTEPARRGPAACSCGPQASEVGPGATATRLSGARAGGRAVAFLARWTPSSADEGRHRRAAVMGRHGAPQLM